MPLDTAPDEIVLWCARNRKQIYWISKIYRSSVPYVQRVLCEGHGKKLSPKEDRIIQQLVKDGAPIPTHIWLTVACNHPDTGEPTGKLASLKAHFLDGRLLLSLKPPPLEKPRFLLLGLQRIRISDRVFPYQRYKHHCEQGFLDAILPSLKSSVAILNWLKELNWTWVEGDFRAQQRWEAKGTFDSTLINSIARQKKENVSEVRQEQANSSANIGRRPPG